MTKVLLLSSIKKQKMSVILTYNVNGIRAALRKDFDKWLKQHNEDRGAFTDEEVPIEHKDEFKIFEDTIEVEQ